jgi:hypothetical protein
VTEISTQQRTIRPLWRHGRATVIPSPVEEIEHPGGLVVPLRFDGDDDVKRGILVHADTAPEYGTEETPLDSGIVVYYRGGIAIAGIVVVDLQSVIAYEADK